MSSGGTSTYGNGELSLISGTIKITPVGNLTLGTDTNTNKIGKLTIYSINNMIG